MNAMLRTLMIVALLAPAGCEKKEPRSANAQGSTASAAPSKDADNTAKNQRDSAGTTPTPMDQKNNETDLRITAAIRKAVTDDRSLSVNAHNVKIITQGAVVTLRGPVNSESERVAIEAMARTAAGVTQVINELEVKAPS